MASLGKWTPLVALVMLMTVMAGCVGDDSVDTDGETDAGPKDPVDPAKDPKEPTGPKTDGTDGGKKDTATAGCKFTFCIEGHVYAPVWDVGMTWTYAVTGSYFPTTDYEARFGVFKVNDDHFLLGTDSDPELKNSVARRGVMIGQVQKDSYGVLEHDEYQDLLGFLKIEETTWKAKLWEKDWTLVKQPSKEIEHAKGKSLGIEVNGRTEDGDALVLQYASDAAWLTKLEWTGPEGEMMLSYTLTDYDHAGSASGFKIWEQVRQGVFRAAGNTAPAGGSTWDAGSAASLILAHVETDDAVTGNAVLMDPDGGTTTVSHSGPQTEDVQLAFVPGTWAVLITVDRGAASGSPGTGNMAVFMYSVVERSA